jgi:flagellar basal body-associated protein FliL
MKLSSPFRQTPWFPQARRGSVLILVIVVLVLLALLGTAYITTSRADRFSAQQAVSQTQLDVALKGISDSVNGTIVNDVLETDYTNGTSTAT